MFLLNVHTAGAAEYATQVTADTTINEAEEDEAIEDILKENTTTKRKSAVLQPGYQVWL
ncbi:MAG: hypothetical protein IPF72_13195 [Chitinophagaceae bacterium]|nr:hypothetical protein [Chitinophagaceae bacterium]